MILAFPNIVISGLTKLDKSITRGEGMFDRLKVLAAMVLGLAISEDFHRLYRKKFKL